LINMTKLPDHIGFDVDSQALLSSIDKFGTEGVEEKIHGAFALTWWDRRDNTMHFWRNNARPLWLAYAKDRKVVFWASEKDMLTFILNRNLIEYEAPWEIEPHKELIFSVDMDFNKEVPPPVIQDRKHFEPPAYTSQSGGSYNSWQSSYNSSSYNSRRFGYDVEEDSVGNYAGWDKEDLPFSKKQQPLLLEGEVELPTQAKNHLRLVRNVVEDQQAQLLPEDQELSLRLKRLVALQRKGS
jgi:asparagine synthetase B (glutamine-hydrolysing)